MLYKAWWHLHRQLGQFITGESIWDYDWDILCILDGCRVDTFREFHSDADSYWSVAATSHTWLPRTFEDRDLSSVGYVSANPYTSELDESRFGYFHLEPVRATVEAIETVPPRDLRDHAVTAWNELDLDQLIIHFMQPHVPFRSRPEWFDDFAGTATWGSSVWGAIQDGEIEKDEFVESYTDNLAWVLEEGVEPLADLVDATVGVSADHGNAAGEWGLYGHPTGVAVPAVRKVPWWQFEATQESEDYDQVDLSSGTLSSEQVEDQLEALGYL